MPGGHRLKKETFKFKENGRREGLLKNKRAYLIITSGGVLYSIYKKIIDLETLFREASEIPQKTNKMEA